MVHVERLTVDPREVARALATSDVVVLEAAERLLVSGLDPVLAPPVIDIIAEEMAKNPRELVVPVLLGVVGQEGRHRHRRSAVLPQPSTPGRLFGFRLVGRPDRGQVLGRVLHRPGCGGGTRCGLVAGEER